MAHQEAVRIGERVEGAANAGGRSQPVEAIGEVDCRRLIAAEPNAWRRKRTWFNSSCAISKAYCDKVAVGNVTIAPPVTAPAPEPASAEDSPWPVVARK